MTFGQFFQENIFLFLLLAGVLGAIVTMEIRDRGATGKKVSNSKAAILVNNGGILIDLRSAADFKVAHIARAINIPAADLSHSFGKIKGEKTSAVVVYDESGFNVSASVKALIAQGYSDVFILEGGFAGWTGDNLPVVNK